MGVGSSPWSLVLPAGPLDPTFRTLHPFLPILPAQKGATQRAGDLIFLQSPNAFTVGGFSVGGFVLPSQGSNFRSSRQCILLPANSPTPSTRTPQLNADGSSNFANHWEPAFRIASRQALAQGERMNFWARRRSRLR
jgi:hypothetical protein